MGKIFYIMGKSSSGKDTIYKRILERNRDLKKIVMYTTRPMRDGEKDGEEYHFVNIKELDKLRQSGKLIEERRYHTFYGDWHYFTVNDGQIDLVQNSYLMIGTPQSYVKMRDYFGQSRVSAILVDCDDGQRLSRALQREMQQQNPKYQEMCRRFLADSEDFCEENLTKAGIKTKFLNDDLEKCIEEIGTFIDGQR